MPLITTPTDPLGMGEQYHAGNQKKLKNTAQLWTGLLCQIISKLHTGTKTSISLLVVQSGLSFLQFVSLRLRVQRLRTPKEAPTLRSWSCSRAHWGVTRPWPPAAPCADCREQLANPSHSATEKALLSTLFTRCKRVGARSGRAWHGYCGWWITLAPSHHHRKA